jgi:hypothetical protein
VHARIDDELPGGAKLPFVAVQRVLVQFGDREVAISGDAAFETKLAELTAQTCVQRLRKRQNGVETSMERGRRLL